VEYSIEAQEYALTDPAYAFYRALKTSSEPTSSLFNPLPGQATANVHNPKDASEPVIGFISVSDLVTKRIFIKNSQVRSWNYQPNCPVSTIVLLPEGGPKPVLIKEENASNFYGKNIIDTLMHYGTFSAEPAPCLDCRTFGSPVKPSFWPN